MNGRPALIMMLQLGGLLAAAGPTACAESVDFRRDVEPILRQHCLSCHNNRDRRGGLSLQSFKTLREGGDSGTVFQPGDAATSLLIHAITIADGQADMPKGKPPLSDTQVSTIRRWVNDGANWPRELVLEPPSLWSLQPIHRPTVPQINGSASGLEIHNPIDAFVARRHDAAKLKVAPPAAARTLVRRLYLDITGLPPTPAEVATYVSDPSPTAYQHLVERLLASPAFGERWGRHWLDLARYGDSEGYLGDALRPHAWVFREWVIKAINRDQPFDQFTVEQLAGDLLAAPTLEQRIATGFHRNTLRNTEAGVDLELYRTKEVVDRVNTTGMVWLGLTLGCAECHDHKHDAISQTEFYRLYAFFNNADEVGVPATQPWEQAEYERHLGRWSPRWRELTAKLQPFQNSDVTAAQQQQLMTALAESSKSIDWKSIEELHRTEEPGWPELKAEVETHWKQKPVVPNTKARSFTERTKDRRETFVHVRGVYKRRGEQVQPGTPTLLPSLDPRGARADRLDLARWLFDPGNPLTARVAVNRIWQHLFGHGLVTTPNDFGNQGSPPSHPELLDWLASEYRRSGWSRKTIIRLIVNSSTYRLSSAANAVPAQEQVGNRLLWRQNSFRVSAEVVRDLHLAASGLLDRTIGRRGIRPPLPGFVTEVGRSVAWPESVGGERYRRGMYIFFKRTVPYPMLMTFDAPDSTLSCSKRERSNTPLQALTLLNDPVFYECAETLGRQMHAESAGDFDTALDHLLLRCLGRYPTSQERDILASAYRDVLRLKSESDESARTGTVELEALIAVARIALNLDEFITRD